ncbi:MAG: hypothetical protein DWQ02_12615 [Bacteroidetes bacterium]|nr:MAG: hypothetical protein DWQ02_12615 [Bacteroidota bacterium]
MASIQFSGWAIRSIIILLSILISSSFLFGQDNFIPGTINTLSGETLEGKIDYANWERNPEKIKFKSSDGSIQVYEPGGINGEMPLELAGVALPHLTPEKNPYCINSDHNGRDNYQPVIMGRCIA